MPDHPPEYSGAMQEYSDEHEDMALVTCPDCGYEHRVRAEVEDFSCDDCYHERRGLREEQRREWAADIVTPDPDDIPW